MYSLKQVALLAYNIFKNTLNHMVMPPFSGTLCLWGHTSRPTKFCLCVNDFGIKSFTQSDEDNLLQCLDKHYKLTTYPTGKQYCALLIDWHHDDGYVNISIPKYVPKNLQCLQHTLNVYPQSPSHTQTPIKYRIRGRQQDATHHDASIFLSKKGSKHIQMKSHIHNHNQQNKQKKHNN